MQSYKGDIKMVKRYSQRPIKDIYAKLVRQGDEFEEGIVNGEPTITFKPVPFNDGNIVGAFAVCLYQDGGLVYDTMSLKDLENTRSASKAKSSPAWQKFTGQMYLKTVLHRLCKHLSIDMDASAKANFDAGTEIETDPAEIAAAEIAENANKTELQVDFDEVVEG
jgi:recombination protein RecT